jgi:hypothetical protein
MPGCRRSRWRGHFGCRGLSTVGSSAGSPRTYRSRSRSGCSRSSVSICSVRPYPAGDAINDAAQVALLGRLRARCHPSLVWRTEVPLPLPGDLRAWDATITSDAIRAAVEAETRLRDLQALDRRLALKQRDGGFDHVILLVLGSRANRSIIRAHADTLRTRFPVAGVTALERLETGSDLGGNALIVL